jgi:hypothetical protein
MITMVHPEHFQGCPQVLQLQQLPPAPFPSTARGPGKPTDTLVTFERRLVDLFSHAFVPAFMQLSIFPGTSDPSAGRSISTPKHLERARTQPTAIRRHGLTTDRHTARPMATSMITRCFTPEDAV